MKWMSVFVFAILLVFLSARHIHNARYQSSLVNPDIFPAFIQIENHALLYVEQRIVDRKEYERCKSVIKKLNQDSSAEEYYTFLLSLGFDLPSYKLSASPTKEQQEQAMQESLTLREEQGRILKMQIEQSTQELLNESKESLDK